MSLNHIMQVISFLEFLFASSVFEKKVHFMDFGVKV